MTEFKEFRHISQIAQPLRYAYCAKCNEIFINDTRMYGVTACPVCSQALEVISQEKAQSLSKHI